MKNLIVALVLLLAMSVLSCGGGGSSDLPIPVSPTPDPEPTMKVTLKGIAVNWPTLKKAAKGSDNFATTWSSDGNQYTVWGDGFGFAQSGAKKSLGVSIIKGTYSAQSYQDLTWTTSGKSYGILAIDNILYMWVGSPGSMLNAWNRTRLYTSKDSGKTWTRPNWEFTKTNGFHTPTFLQAGKGYTDAKDGYVYSYAPGTANYKDKLLHKPARIYLMRVKKADILKRGQYQFYTGGIDNWSSDIKKRHPCVTLGSGGEVSVIYIKDLNKYILATQHLEGFAGNLSLYQSNNPFGPWYQFYVTTKFGQRNGTAGKSFYWNFSAKWSSGYNFAMIFSGTGDDDRYMSVKGKFK